MFLQGRGGIGASPDVRGGGDGDRSEAGRPVRMGGGVGEEEKEGGDKRLTRRTVYIAQELYVIHI